ncbi:hypothetical protein ACHAXH_008998 [Discostella pseudostelligera]|jgi:hypothetical protein
MCRPNPSSYVNRVERDTLPKTVILDETRDVEDGYYSVDEDDAPIKPSSRSNIIQRFIAWYSHQMDSRPVLTKSITGGCSAIVGDLLAQYIEYNYELIRDEEPEGFHLRRVVAMFMTGMTYGPMLHYVYEFYEHVFPIDCDKMIIDGCRDSDLESDSSPSFTASDIPNGDKPSSISFTPDEQHVDRIQEQYSCTMFYSFYTLSQRKYMNAFLHVAIDQCIMGFVYVAIMMIVTGVVEGQWRELQEEFHDDYIDNVRALWIAALIGIGPMQLIAFRYLPLKWRCMAVNVLDVFEVMVMSTITHRNRELN